MKKTNNEIITMMDRLICINELQLKILNKKPKTVKQLMSIIDEMKKYEKKQLLLSEENEKTK